MFTFFSGGMIDQFGSLSRASIQRGAFEELQRPAPPPYSSISRLNPTEEDEGTYLVWIFLREKFSWNHFHEKFSSNWFHGKIFQIWSKPRRILWNNGLVFCKIALENKWICTSLIKFCIFPKLSYT